MRRLRGSMWALALGCTSTIDDNQLPTATLAASPEFAAPLSLIELDATASRDPDGFVIVYQWAFDDASAPLATSSPTWARGFGSGGTYRVTVTVTDDRGGQATAATVVTILEAPLCSDLVPCRGSKECHAGVCRCPETLADCDGACIDTQTDSAHCGGCGSACQANEDCVDGMCALRPCLPPLVLCGEECVDTRANAAHCGGCFHPCPSDAVCEESSCVAVCPPARPLLCPTGCVDPDHDPFNCGGCELECDSGLCEMGSCTPPPPGSVIATYTAPPYSVLRGLTFVGGRFYFTTGRRFVEWVPTTGEILGDWFINHQGYRRCYGLAGFVRPGGEAVVLTGAYNRFEEPIVQVDLEAYLPLASGVLLSEDGLGGAMATDGSTLWVFSNRDQTLVAFDVATASLVSQMPIIGLGPQDGFTDLALDGYGGLWAVRPNVSGSTGPLMCKLRLSDYTLDFCREPPTPGGLGGVVLADGSLWAIGDGGTFRLVP